MLNRAIMFYVAAGILTIGATALPSASMAAVITATASGVPDGAAFYENFDNLAVQGGATSKGITVSFNGKGAGTASLPNLAGYYGAPIIIEGSAISFGNSQATGPNTTQYLTTGIGQVIMELDVYHQYFGLLWGSVDDHNLLSFYDGDTFLFGFTGLDVKGVAEGGQKSAGTFYVNINSTDYFNKVIASSTKYGFEFDNVALAYEPISLSIHGEVPEPGTLALLSLGLLVGIIARRRRC